MGSAFPLLRLPSVAFRLLARLLDLDELIKIGLCSEKSKSLVKCQHVIHYSKKPTLTMTISVFFSCITIQYFDEGHSKFLAFSFADLSELPVTSTIQYWNFFGFRIMVHQTAANAYETYWGDRMTGAKTLLSYITDLLNTPVHKMSITFSYKTKYPQNAADWVLSRQNSVDTLILEGKYCDEKDVHHVLDKFRVTNTLYLGVSTSGSFQRSITAQLNRIQLVNTPWLTIDHLLDMNSSVIVIDKTRFTNRDMNRFLKCWVNGGHPRLRRLSLEMEPIRLEVLTEGLDMTVVRRETHKRYIVNERETVTIGDSWDIRRDRTASILDYEMEFGLRKLFSLVVWPDSKGNRYDL